jgi:phosphopantothenoylcysteine decarboxylase/phosphopantothenate--cysteine ligase
VTTDEIVAAIRSTLGRNGVLAGLRLMITAGGTQEPLDPVRHIGNRSSGRMGYALAEAARDAGAQVTLIHAPTGLPAIHGIEMVPVRSAAQMHDAVVARLPETDALVMSAAVADYRPAQAAAQKIKKSDGGLSLELERTQDILAAVAEYRSGHPGERPGVVVGFAAETENLLTNARDKLQRKRLDLMVANDVAAPDSGFDVDTNRVTLLTPDGGEEPLPLMSKFEVAERIVERIARIRSQSHGVV